MLAQAVAELVKDELAGDVIDMIEFLAEMERRAAAVPAGNQAKAPTALDEMRALQEGAATERALANQWLADKHDLEQQLVRWQARSDEFMAQLRESREALARVEAEREAQDSYIATLEQQLTEARRALSALDQAASEAEVPAMGPQELIERFALCRHDIQMHTCPKCRPVPASEAEVTERAPDASSYWVLERRDLAAPAYVAANSEGYHGWTTNTASALRFNTRHNADCHRRSRGYDDLVVAAEHQDVSGPEATESATKEAT